VCSGWTSCWWFVWFGSSPLVCCCISLLLLTPHLSSGWTFCWWLVWFDSLPLVCFWISLLLLNNHNCVQAEHSANGWFGLDHLLWGAFTNWYWSSPLVPVVSVCFYQILFCVQAVSVQVHLINDCLLLIFSFGLLLFLSACTKFSFVFRLNILLMIGLVWIFSLRLLLYRSSFTEFPFIFRLDILFTAGLVWIFYFGLLLYQSAFNNSSFIFCWWLVWYGSSLLVCCCIRLLLLNSPFMFRLNIFLMVVGYRPSPFGLLFYRFLLNSHLC
jgi:hypothetical protein